MAWVPNIYWPEAPAHVSALILVLAPVAAVDAAAAAAPAAAPDVFGELGGSAFRVSSPRNADPPNSPPRRCAAATVARLGNVWISCLYAHSRFVCSVFIFQVVHIPGCSVLTSEGGKAGIGLNRNLFVKKFPPQGGGGSHRLNGSALARIERVVPVT